MTRIDFYILKDVAEAAMHRFAARLALKAIGSGQPAVMHTPDEPTARELDELLWHYPERRFLPHALQGDPAAGRSPLLVTWDPPSGYDGILFNLTRDVPEFFNRFHRVVEIVVSETRDSGRERYRFYRHRGYPLYDHHLDDWENDRRPA